MFGIPEYDSPRCTHDYTPYQQLRNRDPCQAVPFHVPSKRASCCAGRVSPTFVPHRIALDPAYRRLGINRALRLSMINSAQVFSPRPSRNPEENLRVLQSPVRSSFLRSPLKPSRLSDGSSSRMSSPVKRPLSYAPQPSLMELEEEADDDDEDIVLVEGDHPQVVEDEKDLVILEDAKVSGDPASAFSFGTHVPFSLTQLPQTPSLGRSVSRNNLHRAVLIRSAQRAVLRSEKEKEDEMEEMEVLSAVASDEDFQLDDLDENVQSDGNFVKENVDSDLVMSVDDWNIQTVGTEPVEGSISPWTSRRRLSMPRDSIDQVRLSDTVITNRVMYFTRTHNLMMMTRHRDTMNVVKKTTEIWTVKIQRFNPRKL